MSASAGDIASLSAGWERGVFHPVYLFGGPDALQKEEAVESLKARFLKGGDSGLNVDKFDGETAEAGPIVNAYQTPPFLGGGRLVLVRRAQELSSAAAEILAEALATPSPSNCLVLLWEGKPDGRNPLVRAAREAGPEATFWTPFENQLPRWIAARARSQGKTIAPDAAEALLELTGPGLPDLAQEIEKLVLYVKDRPLISLADVEATGGGNRTIGFMEWDRALWRRDRAKSLELLAFLKAQGQAPEALLAHLARAFQKLILGKALKAEGTPPTEMWNRLQIRVRGAQGDFETAVESRGWEELMKVLETLSEADGNLKSGRMDPDWGMSLLVREVC
jgi:DNA polymerase-3 subunit delta